MEVAREASGSDGLMRSRLRENGMKHDCFWEDTSFSFVDYALAPWLRSIEIPCSCDLLL